MAQLKDLIVNGATRFIGLTTAPTAPANSNDTKIATTQYVVAEIQTAIKAVSGK